VAAEFSAVFVEGQGYVAVLTLRHMAAVQAFHEQGKPPAVLKQDGLLPLGQAALQFLN
jgi:hypothetical protein